MSAAAEAALAIPVLLCRYADAIDAGRFEEAAALFDGAVLVMGEHRLQGRDAIVEFWRSAIRLYEDGTPRSRHLISNVCIDLDADGQHARCASQWTVLHQASADQPPRLLASGRYQDQFAWRDGRWAFAERRYAGIDMAGDLSVHLLLPRLPRAATRTA